MMMLKSQRQRLHLLAALLAFSCCNGFSVQHQVSQSSVRRKEVRLAHHHIVKVEQEQEDATTSATTKAEEPLTHANGNLPPVIQHIADARLEFNMNLGKAMDTLRSDMPEILRKTPDFSIYHPEMTVIDPSGVRLTGVDNYKSAIAFFQTFVKFWFSTSSRLQYRMVYDFCRSSIRVSWNIVLIPKLPLGRPLFLDGVSHYKLDASSGKIIEHKIENLVMNNTPIAPPYGIFSLLQQHDLVLAGSGGRHGVPVGA